MTSSSDPNKCDNGHKISCVKIVIPPPPFVLDIIFRSISLRKVLQLYQNGNTLYVCMFMIMSINNRTTVNP